MGVTFSFCEEGRVKNRADAMDDMAEMLHTYYIYGGLHTLYI